MARVYTDNLDLRAGATPLTFDGAGTFRLNEKAKRLVGISCSHSLSVYTTDEGWAMAVRLSQNAAFAGRDPIYFMGHVGFSGPSTNGAAKFIPPDFLALDIPIAADSTVQIDITTIAGSTQTGTHDCNFTLHYSDGAVPTDWLQASGRGIVPVQGGVYATVTALTTTGETAMTGNGTTLNIPQRAKEIVAVVPLQVLDTAITQSEELGGHIRLDYGLEDQGKQEYSMNGGIPGLGTEVEQGDVNLVQRTPIYLGNLPSRELQTNAHVNTLSPITGGADIALNILWR